MLELERNFRNDRNKRVDSKVNIDVYEKTMTRMENTVNELNGAAIELKNLAYSIHCIKDRFMTKKDFDYELKLHSLSCKKEKDGNKTEEG